MPTWLQWVLGWLTIDIVILTIAVIYGRFARRDSETGSQRSSSSDSSSSDHLPTWLYDSGRGEE